MAGVLICHIFVLRIYMNIKKYTALTAALVLAFSAVGCGKSNDSSAQTSSYSEKIEVIDSSADSDKNSAYNSVEELNGEEGELEWFSYYDLNPTRSQPERSTNLALFENKGGKIIYAQTSSMKKYDDLAARLMADDPPDMFAYEQKMTFPANCVKEMFQPIDDAIDIDDPLWADVKATANDFTLGGKHYVLPIAYGALSVMTYNKTVIEAEGFDDPYDLYMAGEWDWNSWYDLMEEYCEGAPADEERYGINGWFAPFIFQSTGKTLINYDAENDEYTANLFDPDLERAANLLYDIQKKGYYYSDWVGSATEAFKKKILFYAMGDWAVTPKEGDNWGIVPMPKDPNVDEQYTTVSINAYMWVRGSEKAKAYRVWNECSKLAQDDPEYKEIGKKKFFENKPYFTDEMYQIVYEEVISDHFIKLNDPGYGISTALSDDDAATNPSKEAIIPFMYSSVMKSDDSGKQYTWSKLRETYKSTIDSELAQFNESYHKFIAE